jgi:hypothetical protein
MATAANVQHRAVAQACSFIDWRTAFVAMSRDFVLNSCSFM